MSYPKIVNTITTGTNPWGVSSNGSKVWFSNSNIDQVNRIDVPTSSIDETVSITTVSTGAAPIYFDGAYVFVGYTSDTNVYQINNTTSVVTGPIPVGTNPSGISSSGTYAWVANQGTSNVTKINIPDGTIANTIGLNSTPVAISSDATYTWVANSGDNTVNQIQNSNSVVVSTTNLSGTVPVGISSDGTYVWVASSGFTSIITRITITDLSTTTVNLPLFYTPVSITSDNNYVWVSGNQGSFGTFTSGRVLQYNNSLTLLKTITLDLTSIPKGISSDGTYVWVANNNGSIYQIQISDHPCFKIDTKILTDKGYTLIQHLKKGDLVKTIHHGFVPIWMMGKGTTFNSGDDERIEDRLYQYTNKEHPEIFEDLVLTGFHSILVPEFKEGQKEKTNKVLKGIYITDHHYRLPACVDEKSEPYKEKGSFTIYHLALEHEDYYMNYGIYANGLLVESCSKRYLKECSDLQLDE